jgi:hypothetical protein
MCGMGRLRDLLLTQLHVDEPWVPLHVTPGLLLESCPRAGHAHSSKLGAQWLKVICRDLNTLMHLWAWRLGATQTEVCVHGWLVFE